MTFNLLTSLRDAADAADDLDGHLTRYTNPAALTRHLRSAVHGWTIHAHEEDDLFVLRAAHTVAHQADLESARARVDAAEDMLAGAQEAAESTEPPALGIPYAFVDPVTGASTCPVCAAVIPEDHDVTGEIITSRYPSHYQAEHAKVRTGSPR